MEWLDKYRIADLGATLCRCFSSFPGSCVHRVVMSGHKDSSFVLYLAVGATVAALPNRERLCVCGVTTLYPDAAQ